MVHHTHVHTNGVVDLAFRPSLSLFASGSHDITVCIYDCIDWSIVAALADDGPVTSVAFHSSMPLFACEVRRAAFQSEAPPTVHIHSTTDWTLANVLDGYSEDITAIVFHPSLGLHVLANGSGHPSSSNTKRGSSFITSLARP